MRRLARRNDRRTSPSASSSADGDPEERSSRTVSAKIPLATSPEAAPPIPSARASRPSSGEETNASSLLERRIPTSVLPHDSIRIIPFLSTRPEQDPIRTISREGRACFPLPERQGHGAPRPAGKTPCPQLPRRPLRYSERIRISTLRFWNRPFSVLLSAIGRDSPYPTGLILSVCAAPFSTRYFFTAAALRSDRAWLYLSVPRLSVCPSTEMLYPGYFLTKATAF